MVSAMRNRCVAALVVLGSACSSAEDKKPASEQPVEGPARTLLGVEPEKFQCDSVASIADLGAVLGGEARAIDSAFSPPRGVPKPCNYVVSRGAGDAGTQEAWTFDVDCRPDYQKRAEFLFAQYTRTSGELVSAYAAEVGSGKPPTNDAGVVAHAPEDAFRVEVGLKGLDHHGQGLLFLDDDAPCYVRVVGPDTARRLALAQLVAKNLREVIAPMPVHSTPVMGRGR